MISDKIKVRISGFVELIIENDAQAFGFIKKDNSPNVNGFLNKLIPNLLELRKKRRDRIHGSISDAMRLDTDKFMQENIRSYLDMIIDEVYFSDDELDILESELWIRPTKNKMVIFDEIADSETNVTGLDLSSYIRSLLNEYARLPQYKRETITFSEEMKNIKTSCETNHILHLTYHDKKYRVVAINYIYGFIYDQNNYIICFDTKNHVLKSFYLHGISNSYLITNRFDIPDEVYSYYNVFVNEELFRDHETYEKEEIE